jgi:hypothetical protein
MIDSLQASLEGESKGRAEALRVKKKLEADIQELEVALDHASKVSSRYIKVKVEHYLLFMFSPPKISKTI